VATAGPTPGAFQFKSTKCGLISDGELTPFVCRLSGQYDIGTTEIVGRARVTSHDGTTTWDFTLTFVSGRTFTMDGTGVEADTPEPGKPASTYTARMAGTWTLPGSSSTTLSGKVRVTDPLRSP
jgi:hypothetical protein